MTNIKDKGKILRLINLVDRQPIAKFLEKAKIIEDMVYIDVPEEIILQTTDLKPRQIQRLIKFYKEFQDEVVRKSLLSLAYRQVPKEIADKARRIAINSAQRKKADYTKEEWEEKILMQKIRRETARQTSKVKSRKPKPKKTFWHVPVATAKYRSKFKK